MLRRTRLATPLAPALRGPTAFRRLCGRTVLVVLAVWLAANAPAAAETWRGLTVAPEHRCSAYDRDDYPYPPSVEREIVAGMGGRIYGPYTGRMFASMRETDIEHIVAVSEAHDSGLCAAGAATRRAFSRDLLNLTLAAPAVNRCGASGKCGKDAARWMPARNKCWFAARVVAVRQKYGLSVDRREAEALEAVLSTCASTAMAFHAGASAAPADDSGLGGEIAAPAERLPTLTLDEAVALRERLADEVLLLERLAEVQSALPALNRLRIAVGLEPATIPHALCAQSPVRTRCGALAATFGPAHDNEGGELP